MSYSSLQVAPVHPSQERNFQALMQAHHYLGALPKIGNTIWYVATTEEQWLAFSRILAQGFIGLEVKIALNRQA